MRSLPVFTSHDLKQPTPPGAAQSRGTSAALCAKGTVILIHGFAEHAGRYETTAARLQRVGWKAVAVTLTGHGRAGIRPDIEAFDDYLPPIVETIDGLVEYGDPTETGRPIVLLGQSMGALVACRIALCKPSSVSGLILSSPAFGIADRMPRAALGMLGLLSRWLPTLPIVPPPKGGAAALSQISQEQSRFEEDPLCWHGFLGLRMACQLARASIETEELLHRIDIPTLMLWGDADPVINPDAIRRASRRMSADLVTAEVWSGSRHHLFTDRDAESHFQKIRGWLEQRRA
jgi:acylglycerol lipase